MKSALPILCLAASALAGCTEEAPPEPGIQAVGISFQNDASGRIELNITVDDPMDARVVTDRTIVPSGASRIWQANATTTAPPQGLWSIRIEGQGQSRGLLLDAEGKSGTGWGFPVSLCPGPMVWFRAAAQDQSAMMDPPLGEPYAVIARAEFSCDGIQWSDLPSGPP